MKIDKIIATHVRVPFVEPFRISSGSVAEKDAIVLELHSDGLTGYGESSAMAGNFYSADTPEKSWRELCHLVLPSMVGRDFECPQSWNLALDGLCTSNFTKAGVETALWDLAAQIRNQPLHSVLGGSRGKIESGLAVGLYDEMADLLHAIERYLKDGYGRVKVKIEPGRDINIVRAVRKAFGDIPLFVDANGGYTPDHVDVFRALDDFGLLMFEQPYPGSFLEELAELQQVVNTPICLDESLETIEQLQEAIRLGSGRIANFKIQRVGGFHRALEMDSICRKHGLHAWVGTMPELGIGQAQGLALASLDNFVYPTDVEASDRWFQDDIVNPFIQVRNGAIDLPAAPGLGVKVDPDKIRKYEIASRSFSE